MSKRHHFVPEMLQKRFVDSAGRLHACDRHRKTFHTKPGNLFVDGHLYTQVHDDGTKFTGLEDRFSRLEALASPILDKVIGDVRRNAFPVLDGEEWTVLMMFFIHQYKRVPSFFKPIMRAHEPLVSDAVDDFERKVRPLSVAEHDALRRPENVQRILKNSMVEKLGDISEFIWKGMVSRGVGFARVCVPDAMFVIGSTPIARFRGTHSSDLSDPTVEMWLPIAPDVAFGSMGAATEGTLLTINGAKHVRHINRQVAAASEIVASSSRQLVRSLMRRQPPTPPERTPVMSIADWLAMQDRPSP